MKLPRDISGRGLAELLSAFGYTITRQTGSHLRLTTKEMGEHHITIPAHATLRIGTLNSVIHDIADHFKVSKEDIAGKLFK